MPEPMGPGDELRFQVDFYQRLATMGTISTDPAADLFSAWVRQQSPVALARVESSVFPSALARVVGEAPKPFEYQARLLAVCWEELKKTMRGAA